MAALYWSSKQIHANGPTPGVACTPSADGSLVGFFIATTAAGYCNINTTYYDGTNTHVQNVVTYTQCWADATDPPQALSNTDIQNEIEKGFSSGNLTFDASTLYEVYTGTGINPGGGFGTQYCATTGSSPTGAAGT